MSNKFNFIDAVSIKYANNVISRIQNYDVIDEIVYEQPQKEEIIKSEQVKSAPSHNIEKNLYNENLNDLYEKKTTIENVAKDKESLNHPSVDSQSVNVPTSDYSKLSSNFNAKFNFKKEQSTIPISKNEKTNEQEVISVPIVPPKPQIIESKKNVLEEKQDIVYTSPTTKKEVHKNIEEKPMKNFNANNISQVTTKNNASSNLDNNQQKSTSQNYNLENEINTFNYDYDVNSINELDNIININDVYDDLGKTFQDDLFNQYDKLDKYVNYDDMPKYSYLPKKRIRDLLLTKYNITNEECVNDLYSMAFNNKWKEIDVEHWLLNPANISTLQAKYGNIGLVSEKELDNKEDVAESIDLPNDKNDSSSVITTKITDSKNKSDNNIQRVEIAIVREDQKQENVDVKSNKEFDHHLDYHHNHCLKKENMKHKHHRHTHENNYYNYDNRFFIKDEMRSVLIEENYRKMQFDFQTEVLKNHIDSKFNSLLNISNSNFPSQRYTGFSYNSNNLQEQQHSLQNESLNWNNQDPKNNKDYLLVKDFDNKITEMFNEERAKIKDEISVEINELKEKFNENEKNIYESLDFIRKEIKENENNLKINFNDSLNELRNEIANNLTQYIQEIDKKQGALAEVFNNKQNELLDKIVNINKENSVNVNNSLVEQLKLNFDSIAEEMSLLKNKINNQSIDNSNEIKDLRNDITNQLSVVSEEMKNSVLNIYNEIDTLSEYVYNKEHYLYDNKEDSNQDQLVNEENLHDDESNYSNINRVETFDNDFGVIQTIRTNDNSFQIPNYDDYKVNYYSNNSTEDVVQEENKISNEPLIEEVKTEKAKTVDYESFANNELENANFNFLNNSSNFEPQNELKEYESNYDDATLTNEDKDFYNRFLNDEKTENKSSIISNFDSNTKVNILDIENNVNISNENETSEEDDIKAKLSRIDEIIKNSIDELSDIKDYVKEDDAKIDESIKLFEQVK
ncbi:hypothetical protein [Malacoplasma muris]|uniref:hypothetical protein n=1 Tax=Malacoplasma muris TaxID=2119 RepID=UPI00398E8B7C